MTNCFGRAKAQFGVTTPFGGPTLVRHADPATARPTTIPRGWRASCADHGADSVIVAEIDYVFTRDNPLFAKARGRALALHRRGRCGGAIRVADDLLARRAELIDVLDQARIDLLAIRDIVGGKCSLAIVGAGPLRLLILDGGRPNVGAAATMANARTIRWSIGPPSRGKRVVGRGWVEI